LVVVVSWGEAEEDEPEEDVELGEFELRKYLNEAYGRWMPDSRSWQGLTAFFPKGLTGKSAVADTNRQQVS
jgi:hypothetical protein